MKKPYIQRCFVLSDQDFLRLLKLSHAQRQPAGCLLSEALAGYDFAAPDCKLPKMPSRGHLRAMFLPAALDTRLETLARTQKTTVPHLLHAAVRSYLRQPR